jgi:glycosyltransferase involved in cell wall biosynthesis
LKGSARSEKNFVEWHIITGEYPPELGGVSDYTYRISQEFAREGEQVHVWAPISDLKVLEQETTLEPETAEVHTLPQGFGWRWLRALDRQLKSFAGPRNILIQYVPHMYGWKSMNLAFCWWIFRQRKHNVCVMFHEVAFPFRTGQPLRRHLLAIVHRFMARVVLRSVRHSFTSTDPYLALLKTLGNDRTPISMLRICSNIPSDSYRTAGSAPSTRDRAAGLFTIGIFSNFDSGIRAVLAPVIGCILENPRIAVLLLGPGETFRQSLAQQCPQAADRISTTGRLPVAQIGENIQRCNTLLQLYPDGASAARGTLIGALASGVPVVTTAGPATDQLLLDSRTMLFPESSPQSIRHAIELLEGNPGLAEEFGDRARRLYEESFQPSVIVSRIRGLAPAANGQKLPKEEPAVRWIDLPAPAQNHSVPQQPVKATHARPQ